MIKHESRLLFLKEFTKELILQFEPRAEEKKETKKIEMPVIVKTSQEKKFEQNIKQIAILPISKKTLPFQAPAQVQRYKLKPIIPPGFSQSIKPQANFVGEIKPEPAKIPSGFNLGKINLLINDPRVTLIECQGPGKLITTKMLGKTTITKISLNQEEIQGIIETFSREARMPLVGGIFKAAVGNLIMTAVISELVGNRFIITKITPSFVIEQANKNY